MEFKKLIDEFAGIFFKGDEDLGTSIYSHKIILSDENPTKSRVPYKQLKVVEEHIDQMLRMGVLRKSKSPWASPEVMVEKSDGSLRFCVDFRKVNEKTIKDLYPMPLIEDKLNAFGGCEFFLTLDIASGYWQLLMDENSIEKPAFTTHKGLYEFLVMAFGMCNAGASFQREMKDTRQGLDHSSPYIDHVITFSKEFKQQLKDLKETYQRIEEAKFKIKTRKYRFGFRETKFLGFIVSKEGVKMDPNKCKSIQDYPVPRSSKDVKRFLGLASYYRKFIPNFADIAAPLNKLTQKNIRFKWSEICESSFRSFLKILVSPQVFAYPDFEKPFILTADASGYDLGAVLSQIQEGEERVICYASRSLKAAGRNYSAIERELLAKSYGQQHCLDHIYIMLSMTSLLIITH